MSLQVSDVIEAIQTYAEPELGLLLDGLCPCLANFPLDGLLRLADEAAKAAQAKNELAAMRAAVAAADAAADAAEQTSLNLGKK